jgi:hypothetical protein
MGVATCVTPACTAESGHLSGGCHGTYVTVLARPHLGGIVHLRLSYQTSVSNRSS